MAAAVAHLLERGARRGEFSFPDKDDLELFRLEAVGAGPGGERPSAEATHNGSTGGPPGRRTQIPGWARVQGRVLFEVPYSRLVKAGGPPKDSGAGFYLLCVDDDGRVARAVFLGMGSAAPKGASPAEHWARRTRELPEEARGFREVWLCWSAGEAPRAAYRRSGP
jgi:hypothetical protein